MSERCPASDRLLGDELVRGDERVFCPKCGAVVRAIPDVKGNQLASRIAAHTPGHCLRPREQPRVPQQPQPAPAWARQRDAAGPIRAPRTRPAPEMQRPKATSRQAAVDTAETPVVTAPPQSPASFERPPRQGRERG